ncbi:DotU/TssL family secretion system protein [Paraburkholderia bryophila]|uniref:DotU family type IV/VI secretion system protein n=1 Tax=Burkholderiaceae TaxID=119060 RepID=UPI00054F44A8|nr:MULTISPECIES: DotU/TssL family secretion system protein [Burkholderiaceae]
MSYFVDVSRDVALLENQSAAHHGSRASIRGLLRDTALQVSTLNQGGIAQSVPILRKRCLELVAVFAATLEQRGIAADVREDALYAQCGLLDETILRYLPLDQKHQWNAQPLQVERFGKHNAGDYVFERLTERMRETPPNIDLLECYSAVLGLGFTGRYAREGEEKRAALIVALETQIAKLRPAVHHRLIADHGSVSLTDWLRYVSPWAIASTACVISVLVYFVWSHALDVQLAHLLAPLPAVRS